MQKPRVPDIFLPNCRNSEIMRDCSFTTRPHHCQTSCDQVFWLRRWGHLSGRKGVGQWEICLYCLRHLSWRSFSQRCYGRRRSLWPLSALASVECRRALRKEMCTASPSFCMRFYIDRDCSVVSKTTNTFLQRVSRCRCSKLLCSLMSADPWRGRWNCESGGIGLEAENKIMLWNLRS